LSSMSMLDPKDSERNDPQGAVALGARVVAGGQAAELLATGDEVLDAVAQPVHRPVERARAPRGAQPGDGVAAAAPAAVGAPPPAGGAFVTHYPLGADPRPAAARAAHRALLQQALKDGGLVPLPGRQHHRQRLAVAVGAEMDLGREATPAPAERLPLGVPPWPRPRAGVLGRWCRRRSGAPRPAPRPRRPGARPRRGDGPRPRRGSSARSGCTPSARARTARAGRARAPPWPASRGWR